MNKQELPATHWMNTSKPYAVCEHCGWHLYLEGGLRHATLAGENYASGFQCSARKVPHGEIPFHEAAREVTPEEIQEAIKSIQTTIQR